MISEHSKTEVDTQDGLRVLIVSQVFPPESMGGAHRWKKFVQHMPNKIDCRVVCPVPSFPFGTFERTYRPWKREEIDGVSVTRLWTFQPTDNKSNLKRILNNVIFACMASLYVLLNFWRYDRVVTMAGPHTSFLPGIVAKTLGTTWIIDVFDMWLDNAVDLGYVDKDSFSYWIIAALERFAFLHSDHSIVLTPTMAKQFMQKYNLSEGRLTPVPFGVERDLFDPALEVETANRIVYFGNLGEVQAFKPFLKGFAALNNSLELHIAGSGERREELETICEDLGIRDQVSFLGMIPRKEIPELVGASKLSIVPLRTGDEYKFDYARPTKLLESMAIGTPVVASSVNEIEKVCEMSGGGIAVENCPEEIKNAIEQVESTHEEVGIAATEFIETYHRWEQLSKRVERVLVDPESYPTESSR
jgi:glycosyltransferase involved in cell wall biosynthesis